MKKRGGICIEQSEHSVKITLLKIIEILRCYSNKENMLSTSTFCQMLEHEGLSVDRRTLSKNIELLKENGYDILSGRIGHQNAYYLNQDIWTTSDYRMITDAVQAARFITEEDTNILLDKIRKNFNVSKNSEIYDGIVRFNSRKGHNKEIQNTITCLETAITYHKRASFRYFYLNENKERKYTRNERYVVEPIAMIYQEDFYYLLTWNSHHSDVTTYRIDRISEVKIEDKNISSAAMIVSDEQKAESFVKESFSLFGGEKKRITIEFNVSLIGAVYDKFGEDLKVIRNSNGNYEAEIVIRESPTWKGWLYQFGEKMKIKKTW